MLRDLNTHDFSPDANSPASGVTNYNGEPITDYFGARFNTPRSVGAIEGNVVTGLRERIQAAPPLFCSVRPNPSNRQVTIKYQVRSRAHTGLKIYDILGRQLAELVNEVQEPGEYRLSYYFTDEPSGIYLYQLISGGMRVQGKVSLVR